MKLRHLSLHLSRYRGMDGSRSDLQMVCVVAMARNRVIGDGSDLIWHLPGDLKARERTDHGLSSDYGAANMGVDWTGASRPPLVLF